MTKHLRQTDPGAFSRKDIFVLSVLFVVRHF